MKNKIFYYPHREPEIIARMCTPITVTVVILAATKAFCHWWSTSWFSISKVMQQWTSPNFITHVNHLALITETHKGSPDVFRKKT